MSTFEGVVPLEDHEVPVIVDIDDTLRLSTNGTEIAEWSEGEFYISDDGDGVYTITAESEILRFIPSDPDLFAHRVRGDDLPVGRHEAPGPLRGLPEGAAPPIVSPAEALTDERVAPETSRLMKMLFVLLVVGTVLLGGWAAYNIFF